MALDGAGEETNVSSIEEGDDTVRLPTNGGKTDGNNGAKKTRLGC